MKDYNYLEAMKEDVLQYIRGGSCRSCPGIGRLIPYYIRKEKFYPKKIIFSLKRVGNSQKTNYNVIRNRQEPIRNG